MRLTPNQIRREARTEAQAAAFRTIMLILADAGFGQDEPINGADTVDTVAEFYDRFKHLQEG